MKQKFIIVVVLAALALLSSCTLEKRHYRSGFYFNRPGGKEISRTVQNDPAVTPQQTIAAEPASTERKVADSSAPAKEGHRIATGVERKPPAAVRTVPAEEKQVGKKLPLETYSVPAPLEKDKEQAIGAGVAAAVFFVLGMTGLVIKGTTGPVGIFIAAAFVCFLLCVILASFLYPREPVVKQPKEPKGEISQAGKIGIGLLVVVFAVLVIIAALFLSIFTSLFF